jgi:hypothetical protein
MPHRCEDPVCWKDNGTHTEECVFSMPDMIEWNYLHYVRHRPQYGNTAKVVLNPPKFVLNPPPGKVK